MNPNGSRTRERAYQRRWWIPAALSLSLLIIIIDDTIINVAVPTLQRELGASATALQWIVDSYILVFAGLLLTMGALGDRFGRKRFLLLGLVVFAAASVFGAHAGSASQLIVARALMGVGGAMIMPSTLSVLIDVFPRQERVKAIGTWTGIASIGIPLGPIVGGWLLGRYWWGSVFLLNVPIVLAALIAAVVLIPESRHPAPPRADLPGLVLSVAALTSLIYGITEIPAAGWTSAAVLGSLAVAVLTGARFVWREARARQPMLDLTLFGNPRLGWAAGAITLAALALTGLAFELTQYLQFVQGYPPLQAGLRFLPLAIGFGIAGQLSQRLVPRIGTGRVVGAALGIGILGTVANIGYTSGITAATAPLSPDLAAAAKRSVNAALQVAGGIGGPTGQALRRAAGTAFMNGFSLAMLAAAALLAVGAVLVLRRLPPQDLPTEPAIPATARATGAPGDGSVIATGNPRR